jgi:hypothetical protein
VDWGQFSLLILGAALSFTGGWVAKRMEQRRETRIEMQPLIREIERTLDQLEEDPSDKDVLDRLNGQTDRLAMLGILVSPKDSQQTASLQVSAIDLLELRKRYVDSIDATAVDAAKFEEIVDGTIEDMRPDLWEVFVRTDSRLAPLSLRLHRLIRPPSRRLKKRGPGEPTKPAP